MALDYTAGYILNVTDGVKDLKGNNLDPQFTSILYTTIKADDIDPTITDMIPAPGADSVFVTDAVRVFFSEPMDRTSVNNGFSLTWANEAGGSQKADGSIDWTNDNMTIIFTPTLSLNEGTLYTCNLPNTITDLSGRFLSDSIWSFKTVPQAPPQILYLGPGKGKTGVALNTPVVVDFSEPVNPSTVTSGTLKLLKGNLTGSKVSGQFEFLNNNSRVVFRPDSDLDSIQLYTIVLTKEISDVSQPSLNLVKDTASTFTTSRKAAAPHIIYLDPPSGVTGAVVTI